MPYFRSRIAFSISAWRRWSASSSSSAPSRSVMKAWKSYVVNRASWLPGVGFTRRTMSRTGTASFSAANGT